MSRPDWTTSAATPDSPSILSGTSPPTPRCRTGLDAYQAALLDSVASTASSMLPGVRAPDESDALKISTEPLRARSPVYIIFP